MSAALALTLTPEAFLAGCRLQVERARSAAAALTARSAPLDREATLLAFDALFAELTEAASRAGLAHSVHPDEPFRAAAEQAEQEVAGLATELSLDRSLYDRLAALDPAGAPPEVRFFLEKSLRDFRRAGVDRDDATRAAIQALQEELVRLGQEFGRNIRDDARRLALDPSDLAGLPEDWLRSHPADADGKVQVSTDPTDYLPVMTYARSERTREALWRLSRRRAHPANLAVLDAMLRKRAELAALLGAPSWAAHATADKMIGSAEAAADFIERIAALSGPRMEREYAQLLERKRSDAPGVAQVEPWDSAWLQERIKAERHGFDAQSVRPWFEYRRVVDGVLAVTGALFGLEYRRIAEGPRWHASVESYEVHDAGQLLGRIHLDMHPRPGKYKHFAQFPLAGGQRGVRLPEGVLVCNFPEPRPGAPALLEHGEVKTLFHEFGHLLHHLLGGRTRFAAQAGVATEWDFVEAPSQLLEEWTWSPEVLATFARHVETAEPIPAELVARMRAADEYGKGLMVRQQMFYAAVSLELHRRDPATLDPAALCRELMVRHTPFRPVADNWFHLSFGHLDGYSALYYTYMWSLVIAKDLLTPFRTAGLMDAATARRYRAVVLEPGGSRPAADLVRDFLGRPVDFDAYRGWLEQG